MLRGNTYIIMINAICRLALLVLLLRTDPTVGFVMPYQPIQPTSAKDITKQQHPINNLNTIIFKRQSATVMMMGAEDSGGRSSEEQSAPATSSTSRRRRRKRKVVVKTEEKDEETEEGEETESEEEDIDDKIETPVAPAPAVELKPRDDTPVQLQIKDVREAIGGTVPTEDDKNSESFFSNIPNPLAAFTGDSSSSSPTTTTSPTPSRPSTMSSSDDSLERLLEDARRMKEEEGEISADGGSGDDETSTIKGKIGNVLSTIVTVDFFVVCGFLVWFLLGIFCSSVLKDDTVQILFNNNFETLVQPALGVLMIASIAGNFFKEDEEGMEGY